MTIINTTQGGGTKLISFATQPGSFPMNIDTPSGYDGISSVMVVAPGNLSSANIKKGVEIASVVGTYEGDASYTSLVDGSLTEMTADMLKGLTATQNWAFAYKSSLTSVELPDTLTRLGSFSFAYCTGLTSLTIPVNVTSIGGSSFYASEVKTLIMKPTVPPTIITSSVLTQIALEKIIVPQGYLETYKTATNWSVAADIMEEASE